jgi:hypothetical protein
MGEEEGRTEEKEKDDWGREEYSIIYIYIICIIYV